MHELKDIDLRLTGLTLDGCGRCSYCLTVKPASEFYPDKSRTCGLGSRCISCEATRNRDRAVLRAARRSLLDELKALANRYPRFEGLLGETAVSLAA